MWRWITLGVVVLATVLVGFSLAGSTADSPVTASAVLGAASMDATGFTRAITPLAWEFPRDFGAHPDYQTEWWYYTGNLQTDDGQRFGYQFTIFRRGITPEFATSAESEWRSTQLYMAHFAITDAADGRFFHEERFARGGAELAGAVVEPTYRTWLEGWQVIGLNTDATERQITAAMTSNEDGAAIDLTLSIVKPLALQGENGDGLSAKSEEAGNASHYYSLTRMPTRGTITIGGETFAVSGASWMDHEFSTSALGGDALGWDWFGLQFDDNREMMIGQIRLNDGGRDPNFGGLLVYPDGTTRYLRADSFTLTPTGTWTSPHSGGVYPSGFDVSVDVGEAQPLRFTVTPVLADQELYGGGIVYWEGSVQISGDVSGYGYVELTGYVDAMTGRF